MVLNIGIAYAADKKITSKTYVENQLATKQDTIPAVDTNTVITHTGSNGEIGQKGIYDSTGNYAEQQTSLVTAGDANTGINNALENEFVCIDEDTDGTCLLWKIKNTSPQQILPTGYTALEYLESNGTQWIDTSIKANSSIIVDISVWHPSDNLPTTSTAQAAIGTREGTNTSNANVFQFGFISTNHFFNRYGGETGNIAGEIFTPEVWYNAHLENKNCVVNGNTTYFNDYEFLSTMNTQGTLYLFATHDITITSPTFRLYGRIGYCKIQKDGALVRNFIPARRDSDGKLGMYDLVSNQLFTNQGSGTFIAGPVLDVYIPSGN